MNRPDDQNMVFQIKEELPMLVLTRKVGEKVHIGANIVLTVLQVQGHRIRFGIEAPVDVPVMRAELQQSDGAVLPRTRRNK